MNLTNTLTNTEYILPGSVNEMLNTREKSDCPVLDVSSAIPLGTRGESNLDGIQMFSFFTCMQMTQVYIFFFW